MITGTSPPSFSATANPSIPGRPTSSTASCGGTVPIAASASSPDSTAITV